MGSFFSTNIVMWDCRLIFSSSHSQIYLNDRPSTFPEYNLFSFSLTLLNNEKVIYNILMPLTGKKSACLILMP